jgi:hypothetical protein
VLRRKRTAKKTTEKTASKTTKSKSVLKGLGQEELHALIEKKAYEIFINRGYSHGNDQGDWYQAEKAVLNNLK